MTAQPLTVLIAAAERRRDALARLQAARLGANAATLAACEMAYAEALAHEHYVADAIAAKRMPRVRKAA